jgi:iron complex outermembrane receptor protein
MFSRTFDKVTFGFGTEIRREQFEARAGQEESYVGGGVQSFPGLQPANALKESRSNVGIYDFRLRYDRGFLNRRVRYENYSDFGIIFLGK